MSRHTTTPTDSRRPITQLNTRQLNGSAKYYYHVYRAAEEALHTEIKEAMSGKNIGTVRLRRYLKKRDDAYDTLLQFLQEITRRVRDHHNLPDNQQDDDNIVEYLAEKRRRIEAAGKKDRIRLT